MDGDSDDLFVVIIGDDGEVENVKIDASDLSQCENVKIKEEVLDETTGAMDVEDIFHAVELHGEYLEVDFKHVVKEEPQDIEYLDDYSSNRDEGDEDYVPNPQDNDDYDDIETLIVKAQRKGGGRTSKEGRRFSMVKPGEEKSFVNDLRDQYPDLNENKDLLIEMLAAIMRAVKPPKPPEDFCRILQDKGFECIECNRVTESMPAACRHYQEYHGPRYLFCYACGVDFRSNTNLYKHEKSCSAPDAVVVLRARGLYVGNKGRSRPFMQRVPFISNYKKEAKPKLEREIFACKQCSATFFSKQALLSHGYLHDGLRPYQCSMCPAAYTSYSALSRHFNHHTDVQFTCDHCARSFKVKTALVAHMATHQSVKKYRCEECGKGYSQKAGMLLHVNRAHRHLPPPCACPICPKRFRRMSLLKIHMKEEHGMNLMTRKMFFRSLPTMTNDQLEKAKIVFKNEVASCNEQYEIHGQFSTFIEDSENNIITTTYNNDDPSENAQIDVTEGPKKTVKTAYNADCSEEIEIEMTEGPEKNVITAYNADYSEEVQIEVPEDTAGSSEEQQTEDFGNDDYLEVEVPGVNAKSSEEQSQIYVTGYDTDASKEYCYGEVVGDNAKPSQEMQTQVTEVNAQNTVHFSEELVQYIEKNQLEGTAGDIVRVVCIEDGKLVELTAKDINDYQDSKRIKQAISELPLNEQPSHKPKTIVYASKHVQRAGKSKLRLMRKDAVKEVEKKTPQVPRPIQKQRGKAMAVQVMRTKTIIKRDGEKVVQTTMSAAPNVTMIATNLLPSPRGRRGTTIPVGTPNEVANVQSVEATKTEIVPRNSILRNTRKYNTPSVTVTVEALGARSPSKTAQQKRSVDAESVIKRLGSGITVTRNSNNKESMSKESETTSVAPPPVSGNLKGRLRRVRKGPSMPEL